MKLNRSAWMLSALLATSCALRPPGLEAPTTSSVDLGNPGLSASEQQPLSERNEVIVRFKPGAEDKDIGVALVRDLLLPRTKLFKVESLEDQAALLAQLRHDPDVEYAEPNPTVTIDALPSDPKLGDLWGFDKVGMATAWATTLGDSTVKVAVIDTGVNYKHPDLAANCLTADGFDFINYDSDPMDDQGHGTHVAGTIAAVANSIGVVGAAPNCKIIPIKALGLNGGSGASVASAIVWAVSKGADVINLSLGSNTYTLTERNAVDYAVGKGVIVVAAAGNSNTTRLHYPAGHASTIAVGATDPTDKRASFSNYGPWVNLSAPGTAILSTDYVSTAAQGNYSIKQGTSMATPLVAGIAALVRSVHPDWTVEQVEKALIQTSDNVATSFNATSNFPRVNAAAAVALSSPPADAPPAVTKFVGVAPSVYGGTLKWEISEPVAATVTVSKNADLSSPLPAFAGPASMASAPMVTVDGLDPNTTYYYRLSMTDPAGQSANEGTAPYAPDGIRTFKTLPVAYTGLSVAAVPIVGTRIADPYKMLIRWKTNVPTTSKVELGFSSSDLTFSTVTDSALTTDHAVTVGSSTPLMPGKLHYYKVSGNDGFGNATAVTAPKSFTAPNVAFTSITYSRTSSSITMNWKTNIATTDWAGAHLTTPASIGVPTEVGATSTSHTYTITGLSASKAYYVKIGGMDANGYPITSSLFRLSTLAP